MKYFVANDCICDDYTLIWTLGVLFSPMKGQISFNHSQ